MVQLHILTGQQAGNQLIVRRFPFCLGRSAGNHCQLGDDGVWGQHCTLILRDRSVVAQRLGEALLAINQKPVTEAALRNGDILELGGVKIRFALAPAPQRRLFYWEAIVWSMLALVTATQLGLIYWLIDQ
jgi:hypothetical protein